MDMESSPRLCWMQRQAAEWFTQSNITDVKHIPKPLCIFYGCAGIDKCREKAQRVTNQLMTTTSGGWTRSGKVHVCVCACVHAQSCLTLYNPTNCSPPGSCVHGILQARILEWASMPSSRVSPRPRIWTHILCHHYILFFIGHFSP